MKHQIVADGESRVKVDPERMKTLRATIEARYAPEMARAKGLRYLILRGRLNWECYRASRKLYPSPYSLYYSG